MTALTKTKIKVEEQQQIVNKNFTIEKIENIEEKAFEFIKQFEGFNPNAYLDYKHYSIGYGTTTRNSKESITEQEAKTRAIQKIKDIRKNFNLYDLEDNIELALISFTYNVGSPPSNYRRYLTNNYNKALKNLMLKYVYAGGNKLKGLEKRRRAEVNLF